MFPWNPDLNIQLSTQHFQLMNRVSNLVYLKPNCWFPNLLSLKLTSVVFSISENGDSVILLCSVKQNSCRLFSVPSFSISEMYTGSNHCSHVLTVSTLECDGHAVNYFQIWHVNLPPGFLLVHSPSPRAGIQSNPHSHRTRMAKSSSASVSENQPLLTWNIFPGTWEWNFFF